MKKKNKWVKKRHYFARKILAFVLYGYTKIKYGLKYKAFKDKDREYLILYNHQTAFDQFFIGLAVKKVVYHMASEDLFSNGFISSLIRYLVAPIPIKKQTTDPKAVMDCFKVKKEGGSIAIAPEGNRTFSGKTEYFNPAIVPLIKKLKLPVAIFKIQGGYGVQPRWADKTRKGKMSAGVSKVIEPSEYENLSNEDFYELLKTELFVDEGCVNGLFYGKKLAEHLERAVYVCPDCGLTKFYSKGNFITCSKCGKKIEYLPTKELRGVNFKFNFRFVKDWIEYQNNFIINTDLSKFGSSPIYVEKANLFNVILYKRKELLIKHANVSLYYNKLVINESLVLDFDEVSTITVLGRNKLNIYHNDKLYQLKSSKDFNALKFVNIFYKYKESKKNTDEKITFLGL